jgi:guanyl-specific ribonuclease Sa
VALYLHVYGELPGNFITKSEARELGWNGGGLDGYADGKSIGGDRFGNYEGLLPDGDYHECDINTMHASGRGAERLVYSDDGRIYYTDDHYESFTLLYGEE